MCGPRKILFLSSEKSYFCPRKILFSYSSLHDSWTPCLIADIECTYKRPNHTLNLNNDKKGNQRPEGVVSLNASNSFGESASRRFDIQKKMHTHTLLIHNYYNNNTLLSFDCRFLWVWLCCFSRQRRRKCWRQVFHFGCPVFGRTNTLFHRTSLHLDNLPRLRTDMHRA